MKNVVKLMILSLALFITQQGIGYASAIQAGDQMISVKIGAVIPTNELYNFLGQDRHWSKSGFDLGIQYQYFVSDKFAIGAEVGQNWFSNKKYDDISLAARMTNLFFITRYNLFENDAMRFYIPAGIGVSRIHLDTKDLNPDNHNGFGFSWNIGLGIEKDVSKDMTIGLESRFNQTNWEEWGFDEHFNYASILVKISHRF